MKRDVFFIERADDSVPKEPPWELVMQVADTLKAAGYSLNVSQESSYLFDKIREGILENGITHYTNAINLQEAVLPDNTPKQDLLDTLRYMLRNIQASSELLVIDPYFFKSNGRADYLPYLEKLLSTTLNVIANLVVVTYPNPPKATRDAFVAMVKNANSSIVTTIKTTDAFHDRLWIADGVRGLYVGTSLNGIGRRYAIADYLKQDDVKDVYARCQSLP